MKRVRVVLIFITLLVFSIFCNAQNAAVVRYIEGKAYVQGESSTERELLTINSPIFEGDNLWVTDGNLGIVFYDGTTVWITKDTHIEIAQLPNPYRDDPIGLRMNLWQGMALLEAKFPVPTESSHIVITPSASVRTARKSLSLIEVESVDRSRLTVLDGSVIISSGGYSNTVWENQMSYAEYGREPSTPVSIGNFAYPELVEFRQKMTNQPIRSPKSWEYVDPQLYAFATDLDYYGYWKFVPGYGNVWIPSPAYIYVGWNPYFYGYWRFTPWGCTWISYDPWGWIPFHYGSWTYIVGIGWAWMPDVWFSPAWVAWYWGDGWFGWCPWGYYGGIWGPIWHPYGWYQINITNIYAQNITKIVVVNKGGPPPAKPVLPVPKNALAKDTKFANKIGNNVDIVATPTGGLKIHPSKLQDIASKRVSFDDIKKSSIEPIKDRRVTPTSLDRDKMADLDIPATHKKTRGDDGIISSKNRDNSVSRSTPLDLNKSSSNSEVPEFPVRKSIPKQGDFNKDDGNRSKPDETPSDSSGKMRVNKNSASREVPNKETPKPNPPQSGTPSKKRSQPSSNDAKGTYPKRETPFKSYSPPPSPPPQTPSNNNKRSSIKSKSSSITQVFRGYKGSSGSKNLVKTVFGGSVNTSGSKTFSHKVRKI